MAVASGVRPSQQETPRGNKPPLQLLRTLEVLPMLVHRRTAAGRRGRLRVPVVEVGLARLRGHGFEYPGLKRRMTIAVALEHGQCARDGDMMPHQQGDQRFRVGAVGVHCFKRRSTHRRGADVGLLAGIELSVDEEAVLQIVDAKLCRLRIGHGAKVASHLQALRVGFVDCGF